MLFFLRVIARVCVCVGESTAMWWPGYDASLDVPGCGYWEGGRGGHWEAASPGAGRTSPHTPTPRRQHVLGPQSAWRPQDSRAAAQAALQPLHQAPLLLLVLRWGQPAAVQP